MADIEKTIVAEVPLSTAYNQWTQFESFPHFMQGVKEVRQIDDRHLHWRAEVGGDSGGSYSNNFATVFTVTNTDGSVTNYLDAGAATNFPSRYYRVRVVS